MKNEKETALGAENTESGKANESDSSLSELEAKVKRSQAMGPMLSLREPTTARPILDLRTEMFMLNQLKTALARQYSMSDSTRYEIFSGVLEGCLEASGDVD